MELDNYKSGRKFSDPMSNQRSFFQQRQGVRCCCCRYPIILSHCKHLEHAAIEDLCDKILSCSVRLNKRSSNQPRSAKNLSAADLYASLIAHRCQYALYHSPHRECQCSSGGSVYHHPRTSVLDMDMDDIDMELDMSSSDLQNIIFPRKCFSLPHCYKHHIALNCGLAPDDRRCPKCSKRENKLLDKLAFASFTHRACEPQPSLNFSFKKKNSPSEFKIKLDIMKKWFGEFSDEQKNAMLKAILGQCGLAQNHLLSLRMAPALHYYCPPNCEDPFSWLPQNIALHILSYLDPISLCRCSQVCRMWNELSSEPQFWQYFCRMPKWQLSRAGEQKQMITFRLSNGRIDWKKAFAERFRLNRNWLKGFCHVRTFHGHTQGVFCVQFDDTRIVSGSSDKTIKVWNIRTNSPWSVMTLVGHSGTVRCLHLEGNRLVSGSSDCTIKVWDLSTQHTWSSIACKVTMVGHTDTVRCLQVDEEKVVSGSYDHTLKVWDIKTGQCKMTLRGHEGAVLCLQFDEVKIISGSGDKTIKIWRLTEGECILTLRGHEDAVTCLQFDVSKIISGSLDRTIKFWSLNNGSCLSTLDWMKSEGHTGVVRCLQADRWRIVSAGDDKTLKVWSLETGKRLVTLRNHSDGVTCLQFNDSVIVSGSYDQTVKLWDFSVC